MATERMWYAAVTADFRIDALNVNAPAKQTPRFPAQGERFALVLPTDGYKPTYRFNKVFFKRNFLKEIL